ncbi:hypothetical protein NKJ84_29135 [Mesorhizobium sp. M0048]|uniref:NrtR DNA-binding winged helix domain-containing protein n=1 Tax=Mesorhizobium sp. M0048 TaxID=2956860 RepID=UPI00333B0DB8
MSSSASAALDAASSTARPPGPASPLHPSGRSAHSSLKPRIVTFVINNVVGFLTDGNALTRTALTTTSAGALQQNFRRLMEQQELVAETGESAFDTGGRPAKLYRFRHHVLDETEVARTKLPLARA